jgi:hypothetical protein
MFCSAGDLYEPFRRAAIAPTQSLRIRTVWSASGNVGIGLGKRLGGDRIVQCPIAWLPPGHDPGAGGGVAPLPGSGALRA